MTEDFEKWLPVKWLHQKETFHEVLSAFVKEVERRAKKIAEPNFAGGKFQYGDFEDAYFEVVRDFGLEEKP